MFNQKEYVPPPIAARLARGDVFGQYSKRRQKPRYKDRLRAFLAKSSFRNNNTSGNRFLINTLNSVLSKVSPGTMLGLTGKLLTTGAPVVASAGLVKRATDELRQRYEEDMTRRGELMRQRVQEWSGLSPQEKRRREVASDKANNV